MIIQTSSSSSSSSSSGPRRSRELVLHQIGQRSLSPASYHSKLDANDKRLFVALLKPRKLNSARPFPLSNHDSLTNTTPRALRQLLAERHRPNQDARLLASCAHNAGMLVLHSTSNKFYTTAVYSS